MVDERIWTHWECQACRDLVREDKLRVRTQNRRAVAVCEKCVERIDRGETPKAKRFPPHQ